MSRYIYICEVHIEKTINADNQHEAYLAAKEDLEWEGLQANGDIEVYPAPEPSPPGEE